jgi:diguanylate cyclase (GGDEF)-like protein
MGESVLVAIDRQLTRLPLAGILALSAGLVGVVGAAHYRVGFEISLAIFFLLPVAIASWYGNRSSGFLISLLSALTAVFFDLAAGHTYTHSVIPFWNGLALLAFFLISAGLLDMVRARLHLEQQLARTDALTGILNSRAFLEHMGYIIALAKRDGAPLSLAYIDLDNFKQINDQYGHSEGDGVLQTVGDTLRETIRRTDAAARVGGDEFVLLLPVTDTAAAKTLVAKLKEKLAQGLALHIPQVTCSIGVVTFLSPPDSSDEAIRIADKLMYRAKDQGKNAIVFETCTRDKDGRLVPCDDMPQGGNHIRVSGA